MHLPKDLTVEEDERVMVCFHRSVIGSFVRIVLTLGLYELWRRHSFFIVTTKRVAVAHGLVFKHLKAIPIAKVQDVTLDTGILKGGVALSSAGGFLGVEAMGPLRKKQAREVANAIQQAQVASG